MHNNTTILVDIESCLKEIGLGCKWDKFRDAGIIDADSLSELDVTYFEALDVTTPQERRKLFFLVQRIKQEKNKQCNDNTNTNNSNKNSYIANNNRSNKNTSYNNNNATTNKTKSKQANATLTASSSSSSLSYVSASQQQSSSSVRSNNRYQDYYTSFPSDENTENNTNIYPTYTSSKSFITTAATDDDDDNYDVDDDAYLNSVLYDEVSQQNNNSNDSDFSLTTEQEEIQNISPVMTRRQSKRLLEKKRQQEQENQKQNQPTTTASKTSQQITTSTNNKNKNSDHNYGSATTNNNNNNNNIICNSNDENITMRNKKMTTTAAQSVRTANKSPVVPIPSPRSTTTTTAINSRSPVRSSNIQQLRTERPKASAHGITTATSPKHFQRTGPTTSTVKHSNKSTNQDYKILLKSDSDVLDDCLSDEVLSDDIVNASTYDEEEDDFYDDERSVSSTSSYNSRTKKKSGLRAPTSSRISRSALPTSKRTGKQLSAIPSESVPPMSPLIDFIPPKRNSIIQNNSEDDDDNRSVSSSMSSRSKNNNRRRRSGTGIVRSNSESSIGSNGSRSAQKTKQPNTTLNNNSLRRSSYGANQNNRPPKTPSMRRIITTTKDNSWKTKIETIRSAKTDEYNNQNHNGNDNNSEVDMRIRVVVRKRPMNKSCSDDDVDIIHPLDYGEYGKLYVYQPKTRVDLTRQIDTMSFAFDNVFDETSTNINVYERSVRNVIPGLFDGEWASIFAYGQTGSGKTFTMMGNKFTGRNAGVSDADIANLGLYYMAALDVFHALPDFEDLSVAVSMFEIYGGKLFDLLNKRSPVKCLEDNKGNVCFPGLSEHSVCDPDDLMHLMEQGASYRSTGTTSRNADSSRSHAVLNLHIYKDSRTKREKEFSRLTFIDLAGSERGADTSMASISTRREGAEINTSLLALKEVIRALAKGDSMTHVPFRGSRLTQVLKQSFVGKRCRSVMIACISPNMGNCDQTLNTLRYADRVKERNSDTGDYAMKDSIEENNRRSQNRSRSNSPHVNGSSNTRTRKSPQRVYNSSSSIPDVMSNHSVSSHNSEILDELLSSPKNNSDNDDREENRKEAELEMILNQIISTHQAAIPLTLDMFEQEMSQVNNANSDNHTSMRQYVNAVTMLHEEQLSLIYLLREQILQYRLIQQQQQAATDDNDNDSFEDLRD